MTAPPDTRPKCECAHDDEWCVEDGICAACMASLPIGARMTDYPRPDTPPNNTPTGGRSCGVHPGNANAGLCVTCSRLAGVAMTGTTPPNNTPTEDSQAPHAELRSVSEGARSHVAPSGAEASGHSNAGADSAKGDDATASCVDAEAAKVSRAIMVKYGVHAWLPPRQGDRLEAKYAAALTAMYERGKREERERWHDLYLHKHTLADPQDQCEKCQEIDALDSPGRAKP